MSDAAPAIGEHFQAARVVCERTVGAVILRTRRISVPATCTGENAYREELNGCHLTPSEIEAWNACHGHQLNRKGVEVDG